MIFVPIMLIGAALGGLPFLILLTALVVLGGSEFGYILKQKEYRFSLFLFVPSAILLMFAAYFGRSAPLFSQGSYFLIFVLHTLFFIAHRIRLEEMASSFFGLFYVAFTLSTLMMIRAGFDHGFLLICIVFLIQWLTDTGAYFVGSAFGRHKLLPSVSPNKSVEGAVGGVVAAVLAVLVFNYFTGLMPMYLALIMSFFASILGQLGDLFESALKRWADVKDAGTLIPGHGGVLDRFDSLIFIAPFCYYFLKIVTYFTK